MVYMANFNFIPRRVTFFFLFLVYSPIFPLLLTIIGCSILRWQDNFVWTLHLITCIFHHLYRHWENMRCHYVYQGPSPYQRARLTGVWKLKSGVNKSLVLLNLSSQVMELLFYAADKSLNSTRGLEDFDIASFIVEIEIWHS